MLFFTNPVLLTIYHLKQYRFSESQFSTRNIHIRFGHDFVVHKRKPIVKTLFLNTL